VSAERRFVLDTNVLVDAVCFERSFGYRAYELALKTGVIVCSSATFAELEEVLMRPKFDKYISKAERRAALSAIAKDVVLVEPAIELHVCRDPADHRFLELAVAAKAEAIVSRDKDLISLSPFMGIPLIDAEQFVVSRGIGS
jgi:hypothetical protein